MAILSTKDRSLSILCVIVGVWGFYSSVPGFEDLSVSGRGSSKDHPILADLQTTLLWFFGFVFAHTGSLIILGPTARKLIPKRPYWTSEVWVAKIERFCSAIFQLLLSIGATIYLYNNLRDSPWLPISMGGTGSTSNCWKDGFPSQAVPSALKNFYLVFMGYSTAELVNHLIRERNRPDFYELLLHLIVTNFLLFFSYFGNCIRIGSLVILAHSFSDVFVYFAKALVDTKLTGGALSYIPLLVVYVWCRIYLHSAVIMRSIWLEAPQIVRDQSALANWNYFKFLLAVLLMLHMYWMFVILKIGLFLLSTGKSRDLQASLSSLNVRQQVPHGVQYNPSGEMSAEMANAPSSMEDLNSMTTSSSEKKKLASVRRR